MLQNIKTSFNFMDKEMIGKIITTMITPKLECASPVWSAQKKKNQETRKYTEKKNNKIGPRNFEHDV